MSEVDEWINERTILKVYRGSHAYGTNHEESDIDLGGVCIPPRDYLIGFKGFEQWEDKNYTDFPAYRKAGKPAEITIFGLHKFVHLAFNCNPNIIEHLFVDPTHILHCDDYGRQLLDSRHLFLSRKARHTFGGYAIAQLRKLRNKLPMEEAREKLATLEQNKRGYLAHIIKLRHRIDTLKGSELTDDEALLIHGIEAERRDYTHRVATLEDKIKELTRQIGGGNHNTHGSHKGIIEEFGYDCYYEDTEFLTDKGFKLYDDITEGDKIGTINPVTFELEFQNYVERVKKPYYGEMHHLSNKYTDVLVTGNHRMFVSNCHRKKENSFNQEYNPEKAFWYYDSVENLIKQHRSYFHVLTTPIPHKLDYEVDDNYLKILGLYVSEGTLGKKKKNNTYGEIKISQTNNGNLHVYEIMKEVLEQYPFRVYAYERPEKNLIETSWISHGKSLIDRLHEECGYGSPNKRLPLWITKLSKRQADILLDTLIAGDGTKRNCYAHVYYTSSGKLAEDIQLLAFISGRNSLVWKYETMYQVYIRKEMDKPRTLIINPDRKKVKNGLTPGGIKFRLMEILYVLLCLMKT